MMKNNPYCRKCSLSEEALEVCRLGSGNEQSRVMVITDIAENPRNRSGYILLKELFEENELDIDKAFRTHAVSCHVPGKKPSKKEIKACSDWLQYQIGIVEPRFILIAGAIALESVLGEKGIKKKRGKPIEKNGIIYLPTLSPYSAFYDDKAEDLINQDIRLFSQIIEKNGIPKEENLNVIIVDSLRKVDLLISELRGEVSCDLETSGLYPWEKDAKINTIGFGTENYQFILPASHRESSWRSLDLRKILRRIEKALKKVDVFIFHNGKFDCLWMWVIYGHQWHYRIDYDTMIAHYLLDENSRHGLKYLAQAFVGAPDWDISSEEKQGHTSLRILGQYQAHDLYYTRELYFVFEKKFEKEPEVKKVFTHLLMPCCTMFTEIEYYGIYIDSSKFDEAEKYLTNEISTAQEELNKYGDINWSSPKQLGGLLFDKLRIPVVEYTPKGGRSTSESVLKRIDHPLVGALLRYRAAKQQLSFFIEGWKPFLVDNYLHPSFKLHGTVTGRPSCERPNLQQVPRDKRIRSLVTAPSGWTLVEIDLSQIELRIAAELANEETMLRAFATGKDVHWITAIREIRKSGGMKKEVLHTGRKLANNSSLGYSECLDYIFEAGPGACSKIDESWKETRKKAKAINFGFLYGMWWKKFKIYARDNYGVTVTDEQAQGSRITFFETYKSFVDWHRRQEKYASQYGYIRTLTGRKRRLSEAQSIHDTPQANEARRQAINSPVQSFASDLNLMIALQLWEEYGPDVLRIYGTVHDSILTLIKDPFVERVIDRAFEISKRPKLFRVFDIKLKVPLESEASVGPWGDGKEYHEWLSSKSVSQK